MQNTEFRRREVSIEQTMSTDVDSLKQNKDYTVIQQWVQTNPLVQPNPVQSKLGLPSFCCECRDRDRQIKSSQCILCTLRRTKSDDVTTI